MKVISSRKKTIGKADKKIFGHFLEHHHRQVYGGVYDPKSPFADEDGLRADVIDALKRLNPSIIRWPGGCFVSAYDWHYGVGKDRIPTFNKAWRVEESNEFGTDEFIKLCRKLDCEPYICTNAGTGTAEEMSNWVEYCNLENMGIFAKERIANGYVEPHDVKYWSIGNENYGGWEIGAKSSEEWGLVVRESAKMMLQVDPTLQLAAASVDDLDWNINLLRKAGPYLDWISVHGYYDYTSDGFKHGAYDTVMLHTGSAISNKINRVRAYLTALGLEKQIKIAFDEWNLRGWYHPNCTNNWGWERNGNRNEDKEFYENEVIGARDKNDINSTYTMADAVFTGSFLNICLRNCDIVGMACFSPVVNTRGAIFTYKEGIVLRPQYFVFELYSNLLKENVMDTWCEDVPVISGEINGEQRTVDMVDVVVTYDANAYAIAVVNKDPENEQSVEFSLVEEALAEMRIHTVNGPSKDSYNDIGKTEVGITSSEWIPYTGKVTVPAHSVNVVEIR